MPVICLESQGDVLGKGYSGLSFNSNPIIVIEAYKPGQACVPGERCGLGCDPFHKIPVTAHYVCEVVYYIVAGAVKDRGKVSFSQRHPHRVRKSLSQGAGCGFHSCRTSKLGVSWCLALPLTKILNILKC